MATKFVSERNIKFLLYEVFDVESLTKYEYYSEHNRKMFDMVLSSRVAFEQDGEQLPSMVADICEFIFAAANYPANAYPGLTYGASHLIESFGSKKLYDTYVPRMRAGEWQGTMALTEPEAGSSLADITTMAEPTDEGYYRIKGQKIFISAGDHDGVENVVHLLLAKIEGAPAGVKGISLFVVPKKRIDDNGDLVANDVVASGVYHKLGYRGCPIVQLSIGDKNDCRGWLVGEPHSGLKYYRDCRIHPIHEGTTGIQGMDLLGRKVIMKNGQAFRLYISEVHDTLAAAGEFKVLEKFANDLNDSLTKLQEVTQHLISIAGQDGPEAFLADTTLYLEFFGIITIAWQWLLQGIAVQHALSNDAKKKDLNFYEGKMFTLRYYFSYELPKTLGLAKRLMDVDAFTVEIQTEHFND